MNVAGAFNNVHHERLCHNLRKNRIPSKIVHWIKHFLQDRSTQLQFNGATSDLIKTSAGVPQESPLSSILYMYYNAELLEHLVHKEGTMSLGFIDDIVYGVEGNTDWGNVQKLGKLLKKAEEWRTRHEAHFETSKYVLVHYTRNHRKSTKAAIYLNTTTIQPSQSAKYLGITFDQQLRYKKHIQQAIKKGTSAALTLSSISKCN
jgi:hypothetical protein